MANESIAPAASKPPTPTQRAMLAEGKLQELLPKHGALEAEVVHLREEVGRLKKIESAVLQWGIPTAALVADQTARQHFAENAEAKLKENGMAGGHDDHGKGHDDHGHDAHPKPAAKASGGGGGGKPKGSAMMFILAVALLAILGLAYGWWQSAANNPQVQDCKIGQTGVYPNCADPQVSSSEEPPPAVVTYDSPEARAEEMKACPDTISVMDMNYYLKDADFNGYSVWLHDKCGTDTKLTEVVYQGKLTDEENKTLVNLMDQTSFGG